MAVRSTYILFNGEKFPAVYDRGTDTYVAEFDAPMTPSYDQPGHYYEAEICVEWGIDGLLLMDASDEEYGDELKIEVVQGRLKFLDPPEKTTVLYVLDESYTSQAIFDTFQSVIWVERFNGAGDFQLDMPVRISALSELKIGRYLWKRDTKTQMIIECVEIKTDFDEGSKLTVTGRSLESILDRRIIWKQTILSGNFQNGIKRLLNENVISPSDSSRKIPNFVFKTSEDPKITGLKFDEEVQFFGENLYDTIYSLCEEKNIGFDVFPTENGFEFELKAGIDRSYDQSVLPWVVFSPSYDNMLSSNYINSYINFKTIALVGGEGEGSDKKTTTAIDDDGVGSGLTRREMYVSASYVSSNVPDGYEITPSSYLDQIRYQGRIALRETKYTTAFDGEISIDIQYVYGKDFYLGDVVQIENEYDVSAKSRITEIMWSEDVSGHQIIPTFVSINERTDT